jgi:GR25 family glycosyltransferase involved in LPS biosynthesis
MKSCDTHNLSYEIIDAVDKTKFSNVKDILPSIGYKLAAKRYNQVINHKKSMMGEIACHASMIKCWERIVDLDRCCIILEHDALILGDVTSVNIPDKSVVTFGYFAPDEKYYTPPSPATTLVKLNRAAGCHAYAITPSTAKYLLDDAKQYGVQHCVDAQLIRSPQKDRILDLYMCEPPQAVGIIGNSTILDEMRKFRKINITYTQGWIDGINKA